MLQKLSIKNFAIIDHLEMNFQEGFTIITGETGAGKSILLGGLSLILGKRADLTSLKDEQKKCIIEGEFSINEYNLTSFFTDHDIDFEEVSIIRREILPSGKSRAFINDTPVVLSTLSALSEKLVDIHSQHQTLQLADINYQFNIIDSLAKNESTISAYQRDLSRYKELIKEYEILLASQETAKQQYDYHLFLYQELNTAELKEDEQVFLEETLDRLNNVEAIKQAFAEALSLADHDDYGLKANLNSLRNCLEKLSSYSKKYESLATRINSLNIEFHDVLEELEKANEHVDLSPEDIESYNERLRLIYDLQKKHSVSTITELLEVQESLAIKVDQVVNASEIISRKKEEIENIENKLNILADKIHTSRVQVIPILKEKLERSLVDLAMENTRLQFDLTKSTNFFANGKDELNVLISANKGSNFESLKKVASGGEMSRIMLSLKALLSKHTNLPTILFDEIDTGVSGEVSNRMASIMKGMSQNMQVISITHLPQIAAKGDHHFKVFKTEVDAKTITKVKELSNDERVSELAEMLGGKEISDSATEHAKQLLS